jgi:hypothetical protein
MKTHDFSEDVFLFHRAKLAVRYHKIETAYKSLIGQQRTGYSI